MKKKPFRSISAFAFLLTILLIHSCKHDPEMPPIIPGIADSICFESQVLPIIQDNCGKSGCHSGGGEAGNLTSYPEIKRNVTPGKPNSSKLYKVITANPSLGNYMPPSPNQPLTNDQITLIELWIMEGAKDTRCDGGPCDSVNVTFSGTIMPIINSRCKTCHNGTLAATTLILNDFASVTAAQQSKHMLEHILNQNGYSQMPQTSKLSVCNIAQIKKWISDGLPNN